MRRFITLLLATAMTATLVFTGCGNQVKTPETSEPTTETTQEETSVTETTEETTVEDTSDSDSDSDADSEGSVDLATMIDDIYAQKESGLKVGTLDIDLTDANAVKAYTGLDDASVIADAAVSEAMIGSQAYSLVLVQVADGADVATVAADMKAGINPRKWICVEADDLRVVASGNVVMLIMVSTELSDCTTADEMVDAFKTVVGKDLDVE